MVRATEPLVRAHVERLLDKRRRERLLVLAADPTWAGPERFKVRDHNVRVLATESPLAVREALLDRTPDQVLVVLTNRTRQELGDGILTHAAWQDVRAVDLWDSVRTLFHARVLDPLLTGEGRWAAQALLQHAPAGGWPPVTGQVLSRDTAFAALLTYLCGMPPDTFDEVGLLRWSLGAPTGALPADLPPDVATRLIGWASDAVGPVAGYVLAAARAGHAADALPLGLTAPLLFDNTIDPLGRGGALARLEAHLTATVTCDSALRWADLARREVSRLPEREQRRQLRSRAEHLLDVVLRLPAAAEHSPLLPSGMQARLRRVAATVHDSVVNGAPAAGAEQAYHAVRAHHLADDAGHWQDVHIALMALRLARWSQTESISAEVPDLAGAVRRYLDHDAWVERAYAPIISGVSDPVAGAAYAATAAQVRAHRIRRDTLFARLLVREGTSIRATAGTAGTAGGEVAAAGAGPRGTVLVVEAILNDVVRPVAGRRRVLLIILEGMSAAAAAELAEEMTPQGWVEIVPGGAGGRLGALAALPSLTEVSRTALLTGHVQQDSSAREKQQFPAAAGGAGAVVFHPGDLPGAADERLSPQVVAAIGEQRRRVVAAVVHPIGDDRTGPGQVRWGLKSVPHLTDLLRAARESGRVVVLTADHGHVADRGGEIRSFADATSARSRAAGGAAPGEGEIEVAGPRVLGGRAILPWREDLRYQGRQASCHGGASPAEMIVPVLVFACGDTSPEGWDVLVSPQPPWWAGKPSPAVVPVPVTRATEEPPTPAPVEEPTGQQALIPLPTPHTLPKERPPHKEQPFVGALLASATYRRRRARLRRGPSEAQVRAVLTTLLVSHGRAPATILAAAAGVAAGRWPGFLALLRQLLNVDAYEILSQNGNEVELDARLLQDQFRLGQPGPPQLDRDSLAQGQFGEEPS